MQRTLHAARLAAVRASRHHLQTSTIRTLTTTSVRQADPVQDIYLRHLREYKVPAEKPGEAEQHVQKFTAPSGFKSPEEPNLANELSEFQSQAVETSSSSESGSGAGAAPAAQEKDWFEDEDFEAEEKAAAGGH